MFAALVEGLIGVFFSIFRQLDSKRDDPFDHLRTDLGDWDSKLSF